MISQASFEAFSGFLEEFKNESDRGCAVLTLCVLEETLKATMKKRLPEPPNSKNKDAVANFAPKGRLSAATVNAYMLGLLSKDHLTNFGLLIEVRNKFAHQALTNLTFGDKAISNWVRDLKLTDKGVRLVGRERFLIAATEIYFNLVALKVNRLSPLSDSPFQIDLAPTGG